jgi:transporter family protein
MWLTYALLSAVFAALTAVLAKIGVSGINSNLATAIRTTVILFFAWSLVFLENIQYKTQNISGKTWIFLILSGLATGLSWMFYFRALQLGKVSQVAPIDKLSLIMTVILAAIFLRERISGTVIIGGLLMTIGALFISHG